MWHVPIYYRIYSWLYSNCTIWFAQMLFHLLKLACNETYLRIWTKFNFIPQAEGTAESWHPSIVVVYEANGAVNSQNSLCFFSSCVEDVFVNSDLKSFWCRQVCLWILLSVELCWTAFHLHLRPETWFPSPPPPIVHSGVCCCHCLRKPYYITLVQIGNIYLLAMSPWGVIVIEEDVNLAMSLWPL